MGLKHLYRLLSLVDFLLSNKEQGLPSNVAGIICSLLYLAASFMIFTLWQCSWNHTWIKDIKFLNDWCEIHKCIHRLPCYKHKVRYSLMLVSVRNQAKNGVVRIIHPMGKIQFWHANCVQGFRQCAAETKPSGSCSNTAAILKSSRTESIWEGRWDLFSMVK